MERSDLFGEGKRNVAGGESNDCGGTNMKPISSLVPGDVYRKGGESTWRRVEKVEGGKMTISVMVFGNGIPRWQLERKLVNHNNSQRVETKE
jgi:hypothetical protein